MKHSKNSKNLINITNLLITNNINDINIINRNKADNLIQLNTVPASLKSKNANIFNDNIIPVTQKVNAVYKHIKEISNLRLFNWARQTKLYTFRSAIYKLNNTTRINNVPLAITSKFIFDLFKRLGILISKIKYTQIASTVELQFGYWTPRKLKYVKKVWSNKKNRFIVIKKWRRVTDPISCKPIFNTDSNRLKLIAIRNIDKFKVVTAIVANKFNSNIKIAPFKLYKRWQDTSILLESVAYFSLQRNLRNIIWKFFLKSKSYARPLDTDKIPMSSGYLTGIFIKVAGRSYRIKLTNRRLIVKTEKGRYARKTTILSDKSRITKVNKYGTFAITITSGSTL